MKVSIRNFQSIRSADVEFGPGITTITGSTNSGKTAIFRAVEYCLTNPGTAKFDINHDADQAEVTLWIGTYEITWIRRRGSVTYIINGTKYEKCGRVTVWDLIPDFPLHREESGNIINFHTEFDTLFPFGISGNEFFRILERVMNIDDTSSIVKAINEDLSRATSLRSRVISESNKLTKVIEEETKTEAITASVLSCTDVVVNNIRTSYSDSLRFAEAKRSCDSLSPLLSLFNSFHGSLDQILDPYKNMIRDNKDLEEFAGSLSGIGREEDTPHPMTTDTDKDHDQTLGRVAAPGLVQSNVQVPVKPTSKQNKTSQSHTEIIQNMMDVTEDSLRETIRLLKIHEQATSRSKLLHVLIDIPRSPEVATLEAEESLRATESLLGIVEEVHRLQSRLATYKGLPESCEAIQDALLDTERSIAGVNHWIEVYERIMEEIERRDRAGEAINFLEEQKEILEKAMASFSVCETCGAPIRDGEYCHNQ